MIINDLYSDINIYKYISMYTSIMVYEYIIDNLEYINY